MAGVDVTDYDPTDPAFLADPHSTWRRLRESTPVFRANGTWFVTSFEACHEVLMDHRRFSNAFLDPATVTAATLGDAQEHLGEAGNPLLGPTLIMADPPEHSRHRVLVNRAFTGRRVDARLDMIQRYVDDLIAACAEGGAVEFMSAFACPLPLLVIAEILGVDRDELDRFRYWSDCAIEAIGSPLEPAEQIRVSRAMAELQSYVLATAQQRRQEPTDDLISGLVHARLTPADGLEGEVELTTPELLSLVVQILIAGNETTRNLLGNGIRLLAEHPDQQKRLREEPTLVDNAVEEMLRLQSPINGLFRVATEEVSLGGARIAEGELMVVLYGAANRDPARFDDPDTFDVARPNAREHLAFGEGIHYCLGNQLARGEGRLAFRSLLSAFSDIALDPVREPAWNPNMVMRGHSELPLVLTPA